MNSHWKYKEKWTTSDLWKEPLYIALCLSSLSLFTYPLHFRLWTSLQKLNSIRFWTVNLVLREEKETIIQHPLSCVSITFIKYFAGSTIYRITKKNASITLRIHFSSLFSISQWVTFTSKDMKIFNSRFSSFPHFIKSRCYANSQGDKIVNVTCSVHGFCAKVIGKFLCM